MQDANTGLNESLATIVVGTIMVLAIVVSLLVVDKLGRRLLLLISAAVIALSTIALGIYFFMQAKNAESVFTLGWLPVCALCLYVIMFALGFGPVPWLMIGELFASDIKGVASSIAASTCWLLAFIVTKTYANLKVALGTGETFWLFSAISLLGVAFVFFFVPETKGKSLNEIQDMLKGENRQQK